MSKKSKNKKSKKKNSLKLCKKEKLSKWFYHEAIDRIHCIQNQIEDHLTQHPAFENHKKLSKKLDAVQEQLSDLYQKMAQKRFQRKERE